MLPNFIILFWLTGRMAKMQLTKCPAPADTRHLGVLMGLLLSESPSEISQALTLQLSLGRATASLPGTRQDASPGFFRTGIRVCSACERNSKVKAGGVLGQAHKQLRWKKRKSLAKISEVGVLKISISLPSRTVVFNSQLYRSSVRAMHRSSYCHALDNTISMAGVKLGRACMFWSPMKHFLPGTVGSGTEVACHGRVLYTLVWFSVVLPWAVFLDQWGEIFLPRWICLFSFKVSLKDPEEKAGCTGNAFLFVCACCGIFICSINLCMF